MLIKKEHPINEISDLLNNLEEQNSPFEKEKHLIILPDNISINNLRNYVSKEKPQGNNKLTCETFESIAKKVLQEVKNHNPSILENHYLRVFVNQFIEDNKNSCDISSKIYKIIKKSDRPERTQIIEDLVREFSDYLRSVYPPSLNDSSIRDYHSDLIGIADSDKLEDYESEKSIDMLNFFKKIETYTKEKMDEHFDERYYLSRYHLVGEAAEEIKKESSLLTEVFEDIESVTILAISIFDSTIIELLKQINENFEKIKVITGEGSHDRIVERFDNIFDIEVQNNCSLINEDNIEKWELPNPRQEVEFVGSLMQDDMDVEDSIVIARESSVYLPYAKEVLRDFGLPSHVQTRRNLSLSVPFRLVASLLNLLEKDEWTVEDISNPLRLGFSFYHRENSVSEVDILSDHLFLEAEYWLNKAIKENEERLSPSEWKSRTNYDTKYYVKQLIGWIDEVDEENIADKLKKELGKFQKYACHVKRNREARNGLSEKEYNRAEVTKTHMTGDAQRVIGLIDRADEFSKFIRDIEGSDSRTIQHMIRAYWIVGGGDTYGKPRRDKQAVKFVDAANSFFLPHKNRIIVGMRSGTFPRQAPEGKFLPTSFREKVNDEYEQLYLQDPETDYENELDFFEAAMGPNFEEKKIYQLNPYLDDRGHKNNWSVFSADEEPTHFRPADFYLDSPTRDGDTVDFNGLLSSKPKSRWQKSIDIYRNNDDLSKSDIIDHFNSSMDHCMVDEIISRIEKYEERITEDSPFIDSPNPEEEVYLKEMIEAQKNNPVPAQEIDLWIDCPLKYYFYRYVFYQSHWNKDKDEFEKGSRLFIPEYWKDFEIGSVPHVLMRAYFSSKGHTFISNFIEPYVSDQTDDIEDIRGELSTYNCRYNTKENLDHLLDLIEDKRYYLQLGEEDGWKHHGSSSLDMLRPPVIKFFDKKDAPGSRNSKYISLARYGFHSLTIQNCRHCFTNWIPKDNRYNYKSLYYLLRNKNSLEDIKSWPIRRIFDDYNLLEEMETGECSRWENRILNELIENIQNFEEFEGNRTIKLSWRKRKCEDCVYRRLCGDWEVLE